MTVIEWNNKTKVSELYVFVWGLVYGYDQNSIYTAQWYHEEHKSYKENKLEMLDLVGLNMTQAMYKTIHLLAPWDGYTEITKDDWRFDPYGTVDHILERTIYGLSGSNGKLITTKYDSYQEWENRDVKTGN